MEVLQMPEPTTKDDGGTTDSGKGTPAAPEMVPRDEVNRLIAKETAKKGRELGEKLAAAEAEAKAKAERLAEIEAQLAEMQGKVGTEAERVRSDSKRQIEKLSADLNETRKTLATVQAAFDHETIRNVAERFTLDCTQGKERARDTLASQLRRKPDGTIVWLDPETDEEREPKFGKEALQKSDPYFWAPPPSGSGASAGAPPVGGKRPLDRMSRAELEAVVNKELSGGAG